MRDEQKQAEHRGPSRPPEQKCELAALERAASLTRAADRLRGFGAHGLHGLGTGGLRLLSRALRGGLSLSRAEAAASVSLPKFGPPS